MLKKGESKIYSTDYNKDINMVSCWDKDTLEKGSISILEGGT
jgi:hypothetical protein